MFYSNWKQFQVFKIAKIEFNVTVHYGLWANAFSCDTLKSLCTIGKGLCIKDDYIDMMGMCKTVQDETCDTLKHRVGRNDGICFILLCIYNLHLPIFPPVEMLTSATRNKIGAYSMERFGFQDFPSSKC